MKVVFDTNIFVSAFAIPGGKAEQAIQRIVDGRDRLLVSRPIVRELLDVLGRKFGRNAEELARVAVFLADLGDLIEPDRRLSALSDEPDNRIPECAVAGGAGAIVTGDRRLLALRDFEGVRLLTLAEFLERPA